MRLKTSDKQVDDMRKFVGRKITKNAVFLPSPPSPPYVHTGEDEYCGYEKGSVTATGEGWCG